MGFVEVGVVVGVMFVVDGCGVKVDGYDGGYYFGLCLFDNVKFGMLIY